MGLIEMVLQVLAPNQAIHARPGCELLQLAAAPMPDSSAIAGEQKLPPHRITAPRIDLLEFVVRDNSSRPVATDL